MHQMNEESVAAVHATSRRSDIVESAILEDHVQPHDHHALSDGVLDDGTPSQLLELDSIDEVRVGADALTACSGELLHELENRTPVPEVRQHSRDEQMHGQSLHAESSRRLRRLQHAFGLLFVLIRLL